MYHKITAVGYLGRAPEMRFTPNGKAVTNFSIGVSDYNKETLWLRVTTWNDLAERCNEYLGKGSMVLVEGTLNFDKETGGPETYVSKKDGQTHASFNVTAFQVLFLSSKGEKQETQSVERPWRQ
jgi:single-strand DNA-binding protein